MNFNQGLEKLRVHVADFGRVAYLSVCMMVAVTLVLEMFAPGIAGNVVSPQRLVLAAVLAGSFSLLVPQKSYRENWNSAVFWLSGATLTVIVFLFSLRYFESMPVAMTMAFCAVLPFAAYARKGGE